MDTYLLEQDGVIIDIFTESHFRDILKDEGVEDIFNSESKEFELFGRRFIKYEMRDETFQKVKDNARKCLRARKRLILIKKLNSQLEYENEMQATISMGSFVYTYDEKSHKLKMIKDFSLMNESFLLDVVQQVKMVCEDKLNILHQNFQVLTSQYMFLKAMDTEFTEEEKEELIKIFNRNLIKEVEKTKKDVENIFSLNREELKQFLNNTQHLLNSVMLDKSKFRDELFYV